MNNRYQKTVVILLWILVVSIHSRTCLAAGGETTPAVKDKPVYIAAFFPGTSTFSNSRLKSRITRKRTIKNKRKTHKRNFQQFIETEQLIITAASNGKQNKLLTYWQLGEVLTKETEKHLNQKGYKNYLIHHLSVKTDISEDDLKSAITFYNSYRIVSSISLELSWEHYKILLTVEDKTVRDFYQKHAVSKSVSPEKLQKIIHQDYHEAINEEL